MNEECAIRFGDVAHESTNILPGITHRRRSIIGQYGSQIIDCAYASEKNRGSETIRLPPLPCSMPNVAGFNIRTLGFSTAFSSQRIIIAFAILFTEMSSSPSAVYKNSRTLYLIPLVSPRPVRRKYETQTRPLPRDAAHAF